MAASQDAENVAPVINESCHKEEKEKEDDDDDEEEEEEEEVVVVVVDKSSRKRGGHESCIQAPRKYPKRSASATLAAPPG